MWTGIDIGDLIARISYASKSLLDLGCGRGGSSLNFSCPIKVGVDSFKDYAEDYQKLTGGIFIPYDIKKIRELIQPKSFETVIAWDVIEHLQKEEGEKLLCDMEIIAQKQLIIFTPNGGFKQDQDPLGEDNPANVHLSEWTSDDFTKRFFDIINIIKYHRLHNKDAIIAIKRLG